MIYVCKKFAGNFLVVAMVLILCRFILQNSRNTETIKEMQKKTVENEKDIRKKAQLDSNTIYHRDGTTVKQQFLANLEHKENKDQGTDHHNDTALYRSIAGIEKNYLEMRKRCLTAQQLQALDVSVLSFPFEYFLQKPAVIARTQYYINLKKIIEKMPSNAQVHVIGLTQSYLASYLNWMIFAKIYVHPYIRNVLVVTSENELCEYLKEFRFDCIFMELTDVIDIDLIYKDFETNPVVLNNPNGVTPEQMVKLKIHWLMRIVTWRLINFFGRDVVTHDTDAILLKNTQGIYGKYPEADLIGPAIGHIPGKLVIGWKFYTLNMGMVLMRASLQQKGFWSQLNIFTKGKISYNKIDDQTAINYALSCFNITWQHPPVIVFPLGKIVGDKKPYMKTIENSLLTDTVKGVSKFNVTAVGVPGRIFCRFDCNMTRFSQYYLWHSPVKTLSGKLWLLTSNWEEIINDTGLVGTDLLARLTNVTHFEYLGSLVK